MVYNHAISSVNCSRNPYYNGRASKTKFIFMKNLMIFVAILIIMEEPLRLYSNPFNVSVCDGRNPYYNGRASKTTSQLAITRKNLGRNPYYNGRASKTFMTNSSLMLAQQKVAILIIMEEPLRQEQLSLCRYIANWSQSLL